ncbi:hypothetical protein E2X65_18355 [Salmonella enterica]|nr:hypothetical protein [Salmonella enterica]
MNKAIERLDNTIDALKILVVDDADDRDGEFLGYPRAFAYAMDLIYTKATQQNVNFLNYQELLTASSTEIDKIIRVIEDCIAEQQKQGIRSRRL